MRAQRRRRDEESTVNLNLLPPFQRAELETLNVSVSEKMWKIFFFVHQNVSLGSNENIMREFHSTSSELTTGNGVFRNISNNHFTPFSIKTVNQCVCSVSSVNTVNSEGNPSRISEGMFLIRSRLYATDNVSPHQRHMVSLCGCGGEVFKLLD